MYPFTPPGGTGPRNANPCYDNSPVFEENANTVICTGYPFTYNHNATDAELDSLFYSWADPLDDGSGWNPPASPPTVNWLTGYSSTSPLPGTAQNPSNVPASIDGPTGQISYTSYTQPVTASWGRKCGQLVAEIFRDIQVTLINCGAVNNPPLAYYRHLACSDQCERDHHYGNGLCRRPCCLQSECNRFRFPTSVVRTTRDELAQRATIWRRSAIRVAAV